MPTGTPPPDPALIFRFKLEVAGVNVASFTECGGINFDSEPFEYKEGGLNSHVHRFPGRFKFGDLTLKRGVATDGQPLWDWVMNMVKGQIQPKTVTLSLMDETGQNAIRVWTFQNAYPIKWSATDLAAGQYATVIESITLAHQGMDFAG